MRGFNFYKAVMKEEILVRRLRFYLVKSNKSYKDFYGFLCILSIVYFYFRI